MALGKTFDKLLTNKYVLYVVLFFAIANVLGYLSIGDFKSLTIFIVIGILTQYFSKNMLVVLLTTMLATSFIMVLERKSAIVEGFKKKKEGMAKKKKEGMAKKKKSVKEGQVNYSKTVKDNFKNINKMLGGEGMQSLTKETKSLIKQQEALQSNMKNLEPLVNKASKMLESFDVSKLTDAIGSLSGKNSDSEKE